MLKVADFLAQLQRTGDEHLQLLDMIGRGAFYARKADQCLSEPDSQTQGVEQLTAYLTVAIEQLEAARELVRQRA